jgi:succinoglycan biosynthesis transport protein ExoP
MRLSQLIRIIWIHRQMSLCILASVLAIAVAASLLMPKKYRGESAVVVDARGIDPLAKDSVMQSQQEANYVATQVDVIQSHNVALKVVDRMKLTADPDMVERFQDKTGGKGSIRDFAAEEILKSLTVKPARDSDVIFVQFTSKSPQVAADMSNAFAEGYIQTSLELKVDPSRRQAGWFAQQINDLRANLETAQRKLSAYQAQHGVIGTDETNSSKIDVETARLTEISNRFVDAQAAMYDAETRQRQMNEAAAKGLSDESVNVQQNPLLQNLKTELARATATFAQTAQRFDHNHPEYISAQAELQSLRNKVAAEVANANGAVDREARVARQNMADLQRTMDQQRKRILDLQHNQDEYTVLKRDEESARSAYDSAMQRGGEAGLESRLNNTNTAILNFAFAPMKPSSPVLLLNLALGFILGGMLAVGASLTRERFDQRIHTQADLLEGAGIIVLAELPTVRISMRRYRRRRGWFRSEDKKSRLEPRDVEAIL